MAINFTDNPTNGATQTISGRTYTYNSAKNKWDTTATEVTGPTATVYASVDSLPLSGNITGSQALVTSTNRLYIWNGSGWYNIALVNTNPTISGVNGAYNLASDGTATTITITATDPEGIPITYSIVSDTSGNIATVSQGTGSNTNVFTITPSTDVANQGSFSLTFRASDGVNIASSVATFTLQFIIINSKYTTALITSVGANNADNNDFVDSSGNSHTITAYGDVTQGSFSPFRQNGYSLYFDGSNDYLSIPNAAGNAASDTFTVEFWVKDPEVVSGSAPFYTQGSGSSNAAFAIDWTGTAIRVDYYGNNISYTVDLADGAWHHIAVTLDGSSRDRKLWLNGSLVASDQNTNGTFSATNCQIGRMPWVSRLYKGYMRDFRISDNIRYSATFTPPEVALSSDSNTKFLLGNLPYMSDGSSNNHTITETGTVSMQPISPYDSENEYAGSTNGGSIFFNGTNAYLRADTALDSMTSGDTEWTLEAWVYPNNLGGTGGTSEEFFGCNRTSDGLNVITVGPKQLRVDGSDYTNLTDLKAHRWSHVALVYHRGYNGLRYYINGYHVNSYNPPSSQPALADCAFGIGCEFDGSSLTPGNYFDGLLSDVRVSDHDIYGVNTSYTPTSPPTQEFTPPTAPLTATSDTDFLLHATNAGIIDKAQSVQAITIKNGVQSSTTQTKYLTTSIDFTSSLAYLQLGKIAGGNTFAGDYTVEAWIWSPDIDNDGTNNMAVIDSRPSGGNGQYFALWVRTNQKLGLYVNSAYRIESNTLLTSNTWHHIAISRQSGTTRMFIDGTLQTQTWSDTTAYTIPSDRPFIGNSGSHVTNANHDWNGYMSDVRITKGLARYTANFTPPSEALKG